MLHILQSIPPEAEEVTQKLSPDSLAHKTSQLVEYFKDTPGDQVLADLAQSAIHFGLKVLAALLIYIVGAWLIRVVRRMLAKSFERKKTEKTLQTFLDSLVSIAMWIILIVLTVGALGMNTTSLAALLAAGGMAIGMALSGTVQNFAGGIMLLIFKPFKAGDFIEALGFSGTVSEVNIVSTKLTTIDNRQIILPNGALSNGNINNITANDLRRIDLTVGVSYGASAGHVRETILSLIRSNGKFLDTDFPGVPAGPFVGLSALNDSSVNFIVRAWVRASDYWECWFWLNETIYEELPKQGIPFPFPQVDVHLKQD